MSGYERTYAQLKWLQDDVARQRKKLETMGQKITQVLYPQCDVYEHKYGFYSRHNFFPLRKRAQSQPATTNRPTCPRYQKYINNITK